MKEPPTGEARIYFTIMLCFALLLSSSFWLTMAIMLLRGLHLAKHFPSAEAFIAADRALV